MKSVCWVSENVCFHGVVIVGVGSDLLEHGHEMLCETVIKYGLLTPDGYRTRR